MRDYILTRNFPGARSSESYLSSTKDFDNWLEECILIATTNKLEICGKQNQTRIMWLNKRTIPENGYGSATICSLVRLIDGTDSSITALSCHIARRILNCNILA